MGRRCTRQLTVGGLDYQPTTEGLRRRFLQLKMSLSRRGLRLNHYTPPEKIGWKVRTPVLLIAFNRPETTQRVVDRLIEVGAENVYIFIDGPRPDLQSDHENVSKIHRIVSSSKWPKEPHCEFLKENLGCRNGVTHAINWFFKNETEGIILEDDCLPDLSFFQFCSELLQRYREDQRIGAICGSTHFPLAGESPNSYRYVRYPHLWGWATWRRAWQAYDSRLTTWGQSAGLETLKKVSGGSSLFPIHWQNLIDGVKSGNLDSWGYVWFFSFWRAGFLAVSPGVNLVTNIGFGSSATHTKSLPFGESFRPRSVALHPPFQAPTFIGPDQQFEALTRWLVMGVGGKALRSVSRVLYAVNKSFRGIIDWRTHSRNHKCKF